MGTIPASKIVSHPTFAVLHWMRIVHKKIHRSSKLCRTTCEDDEDDDGLYVTFCTRPTIPLKLGIHTTIPKTDYVTYSSAYSISRYSYYSARTYSLCLFRTPILTIPQRRIPFPIPNSLFQLFCCDLFHCLFRNALFHVAVYLIHYSH